MMINLEKARQLFYQAGLTFPTIPDEFAAELKEHDKWLFSTRKLKISPYNLEYYVHECDTAPGKDYCIIAHSGHGVNSYAIQYYLVFGPLRMFLHLGWGGVYMNTDEAASKIRDCFSLADQIVLSAITTEKLKAHDRLIIVGSDFYGSYWSLQSQSSPKKDLKDPKAVLIEVLNELNGFQPGNRDIIPS